MRQHFPLLSALGATPAPRLRVVLWLVFSLVVFSAPAQTGSFRAPSHFIENIGQYGSVVKGAEQMGPVLYGFEGLDMPVLFTAKGLIFLQRKVDKISHAEEERLERSGMPEEEIERKRNITDRLLTMEWKNAAAPVTISADEPVKAYHTYGMLSGRARGFRRLLFQQVYPGIDVLFTMSDGNRPGFEYSLIVHPDASLLPVELQFGGDTKSVRAGPDGSLVAGTDIGGIVSSAPVSYYGDKWKSNGRNEVSFSYAVNNNRVRFIPPADYDSTRGLILDPFVTATGNLTGLNAGKAKDVDFDYAGNIYVTGGGAFTNTHNLAKYDAAGNLLWTFNGSMAVPSWTFGTYYGGWMVEKPTGHVYLAQGFQPSAGFRVVRINTNGLYDNYITTANPSFMEAWKMFWSCNNGSPQILIAGGGLNSNINFGVFTPPATTVTGLNITGVAYAGGTGWAQDIADFVFDPANNDMYSIFGSTFGTPGISNKLYKNTAPYSAASVQWNVGTGFNTVQEAANRPYLTAGGLNDNSANMLWVNASYLYYWDGKNLKAFNKATGAGVGAPLSTSNTAFMQGGIIADACNNIFVGEANGLIKVYHFDGSSFSDAPADIAVPGFSGKAVYDLAYDESRKLLYASGDGFVASFDVSAYCPGTLYTVNVATNCVTRTATATISPAPPAGSVVSYSLFNGTVLVATNTTGIFSGLTPNITYTIVATVNLACSGSRASANFTITAPLLSTTVVNTSCGQLTGSITASGSGSTGPYTYSIDGTNFQALGTFSGLAAGVYTVTVRDVNGCYNTATVVIQNTNGPTLTYTATNADCGNNTGTVTATASGGTAPYQYSINGGTTYQVNNFFTGLLAGTYTLVVKDATNCTNSVVVTITTSPAPVLSAVPASATCGQSNGTITAFVTGGTTPYQYSINGNTFQLSNIFTGLPAGVYTVYVKDAGGCLRTVSVTVGNAPGPAVTLTSTSAACGNTNGTITATGSGGIAPYQYSIDGSVTYQVSNVFTGLAPGPYTITIKDNTGCTAIATITVASTNAPLATAVAAGSSCAAPTGSITITGSGGVPPYTYSINGTTFQVSNIFNGLAGGSYVVYVRDAAGCIGTFSIIVPSLTGPSLSATTTASACGASTGTITAAGSGGTAPLQYSIDGVTYQASNVFNGLAPGIYTVYVKDANNCIRSISITVTNVSNLSLTTSVLFSSCSGNSGTITAVATGGVGALQYSLDGVTYQASNVFTGLAAGTYTIYVRDANGCVVTKQAIINTLTGPSLTLTVLHQATCGGSNGVIRANGTGGTAPLTYNIDGGAFQPVNFFINVAPGLHTIQVKDATGCTATQTVTITNSGVGTIPTDVTFRVVDILGCTGEGRIKNIRGLPSGGGNNYTFSLDGGAFTTANQFRPVAAGVHTITAMNDDGCRVTRLATIGIGTQASATATATPSACGGATGTVTVTGTGPNTPYHISIDNGTTWQTFFPPGANSFTYTGLAPGTYPILVADDADFVAGPPDVPGACIATVFVAVPSTGGPVINVVQNNATCASNNGSITVSGSGGVPPYTYSINGGAYVSSGVFNNLTPGIYAVTVQDASGCITGSNVNLAGTAVPTATVAAVPAACNTNNGTLTATPSGGTAPYEYSLNGTVFQSSNIFSGLAAGTYTVYVKDVNNCYSTTTVTITTIQRVRVSAFTIAASCGNNDGQIVASGTLGTTPYEYSLDGVVYQSSGTFTNLAAGFYTVTIRDARGCTNTTGVVVANSSGPAVTAVATAAICGNANGSITITATGGAAPLQYSIDGINFQLSNIFNALAAGNYVITVKDANGCINLRQVLVGNVNGPQTLTATVVHAACGNANGSITAAATGGTGGLQYSINGVTYQAGTVFNGVAAGSYTLYVKDANNCVRTIPVTVNNLAAPVASVSVTPSSCGLSDGTLTVSATGGTVALSYSINGGTTYQASPVFTGLAAGSYTVIIRDARNCTSAPVTAVIGTAGSPVTPTFNPVGPICSGAPLAALPLLSLNNISGTWSPALNNTTTTTYTFTPAAGQCATTTTLTITVNPKPSPILIYHN